jgi:peptidoglycan/LPS O-acetylase OafA/YrhL
LTTSNHPPAPHQAEADSRKLVFAQSKASVMLDALRGIAALLVCSDHCRHIFFVEYHDVVANRGMLLVPYLLTAAGHQAVVIFFVLSGFLVGGSVIRSYEQNCWSWKRYLTHRFVRLWLVLLPALILDELWDRIGLMLRSIHSPHYSGAVMDHLLPANIVASSLTLPIFFGNAAFLQRILVPTIGTDGALWSLSNEFWYYILFPFALFAMRRHYRPILRVFFVIGFLLLARFVGKGILFLFPIWLAGTLLVFLPRLSLSHTIRMLSTVAYIGTFLFCVAISHDYGWLSDYLLTLTTTAYLWIMLSAIQRSSGGRTEYLARSLANFSYTLYLVHMPFLYLLAAIIIHDHLWMPSLSGFFVAISLLLVVILYAWLVASATEFHLISVRRWVESKLDCLPSF